MKVIIIVKVLATGQPSANSSKMAKTKRFYEEGSVKCDGRRLHSQRPISRTYAGRGPTVASVACTGWPGRPPAEGWANERTHLFQPTCRGAANALSDKRLEARRERGRQEWRGSATALGTMQPPSPLICPGEILANEARRTLLGSILRIGAPKLKIA